MDELTKILYWISTGLLIPVILLLLFFFFKSLVLIGTFYGFYIQRLRFNKAFNPLIARLHSGNIPEALSTHQFDEKLPVSAYVQRILETPCSFVHYDKLLNDFELECQKDLSQGQTLARLGPVLGLMGTLIPMGPALVGLASGDIQSMAANMQVAFSTTVIGLLTGAVGFVVLQVKKRWYATDINNLEFITGLLKKTGNTGGAATNENGLMTGTGYKTIKV